MALAKILIDKEVQFSRLRKKYSHYAGCASHINLRQIKNNLVVIVTTQRTGSTLLCQDMESSLRLSYSPTESFIPLLQGFSKCSIEPTKVSAMIENILQSFDSSDFTILKVMIDYVGWLGFLCTDKKSALNCSYAQLSSFFIDELKCIDQASLYRLVRLDRKNKLKQAISRLINSMGLPTHIKTETDAIDFENHLLKKLEKYPNYHCMIVDQLGIILRQLCLLDNCLSGLSKTKLYCCYELESDLLRDRDSYLSQLFDTGEFRIAKVCRTLLPTSGKQSREMLQRLLEVIGYSD